MAYEGSRTKTTGTWLLPEDEDAFGARVLELLPDAVWQCSKPGPMDLHPVHIHPTINSAMACDAAGTQAFLHLPVGATPPDAVDVADGVERPTGSPLAAIVQLLRSRVYQRDNVEVFTIGRLATSWFEHEVEPATHELLLSQRDLVWSALTATTRPATVTTAEGRRLGGRRIGPAAEAFVLDSGAQLIQDRARLSLVPPRRRA